MLTETFNFSLPEELIAQSPCQKRDHSKLMVLNRSSQDIHHCHFFDLPSFLSPNDVLILNNTKVLPARLYGKKKSGATIELLLLEELSPNRWSCLAKPLKRLIPGTILHISSDFSAKVIEKTDRVIVDFFYHGSFLAHLEKYGEPPLPPYITSSTPRDLSSRYQTVFASQSGSIAAPTAGLHFSETLLERLQQQGVCIEYITLHVGYSTFQPITSASIYDHHMHSESIYISPDTAMRLASYKKEGRRFISVGTTSTRSLETLYTNGQFISGYSHSNLFIYPGYSFSCIDALITNFHLPKSSLFILVSALAGLSFIKRAYEEAIHYRYRFYSFGDAMLIL